MIYGLLRYVLLAVMIVAVVLVARNKVKKWVFSTLILATAVFGILLWGIPFENMFITFDSPQSVFEYYGEGEIMEIVDGEQSVGMLIKKDFNTYSTFFAKKENGGYKKTSPSGRLEIASEQFENGTVSLYKVKGTEDYYLGIWGTVSDEISITDSNNTYFTVIYEEFSSQKVVYAIGYIDYSDDYYCTVNGETIIFS